MDKSPLGHDPTSALLGAKVAGELAAQTYAQPSSPSVTVPREPTDAMLDAGVACAKDCTDDWTACAPCIAEHIWAAMIAAAP